MNTKASHILDVRQDYDRRSRKILTKQITFSNSDQNRPPKIRYALPPCALAVRSNCKGKNFAFLSFNTTSNPHHFAFPSLTSRASLKPLITALFIPIIFLPCEYWSFQVISHIFLNQQKQSSQRIPIELTDLSPADSHFYEQRVFPEPLFTSRLFSPSPRISTPVNPFSQPQLPGIHPTLRSFMPFMRQATSAPTCSFPSRLLEVGRSAQGLRRQPRRVQLSLLQRLSRSMSLAQVREPGNKTSSYS